MNKLLIVNSFLCQNTKTLHTGQNVKRLNATSPASTNSLKSVYFLKSSL